MLSRRRTRQICQTVCFEGDISIHSTRCKGWTPVPAKIRGWLADEVVVVKASHVLRRTTKGSSQ